MPYIPASERKIAKKHPAGAGELAFQLQTFLNRYVRDNGLCYETIAEVNGALHTVQFEFDRRVAGPYEDQAIIRNGDLKDQPMILRASLDVSDELSADLFNALVETEAEDRLGEALVDRSECNFLVNGDCNCTLQSQ